MPEAAVTIADEDDIIEARHAGRMLAEQIGFGLVECTEIATAISELARNILLYAGTGQVRVRTVESDQGAQGVEVVAEDSGPGIASIDLALQDGYSTSRGLGLGIPGTRRLMDDFEITSTLGEGTRITATKWRHP